MTTETQSSDGRRRRLVGVLAASLAVLSLVGCAALGVGVAAGQENNTTIAPYYADEDAVVDNESWMQGREEPTLDNVTHYLTRVGSFVVGSGAPGAERAGGATGVLITAVVVLGVFVGATVGAGLGSVGGASLSVVAFAGLTKAGLAPEWLWAVVLFLLGIVATAAFVRAFR